MYWNSFFFINLTKFLHIVQLLYIRMIRICSSTAGGWNSQYEWHFAPQHSKWEAMDDGFSADICSYIQFSVWGNISHLFVIYIYNVEIFTITVNYCVYIYSYIYIHIFIYIIYTYIFTAYPNIQAFHFKTWLSTSSSKLKTTWALRSKTSWVGNQWSCWGMGTIPSTF